MFNFSNVDTREFSKSDHIIFYYISTHEHDLLFLTSQQLAAKIQVSNATISRFWRKLGFNTIKEFRQAYLENQGIQPDRKVKNTLSSLTHGNFNANNLFNNVLQHIERTQAMNSDGNIERAAAMIASKKIIYGYAPDVSLGAFEGLRFRLRRFGIEVIKIPPGGEIYDTLLNIEKRHTVIVFSLSRITKEMEILFREKNSKGYSLIVITDMTTELLSYNIDCLLWAYRGKKQEYHPLASIITLVDCLVLAIAAMNLNSIKHIERLSSLRTKYKDILKR